MAGDQDVVLEWLRKLPDSGKGSFEGLVASLLTRLTGHSWRVASAGAQQGRDAGSYPLGDISRVVECKRYSADTPLRKTELLGKLVDATPRGHALDAWVLATTARVGDQVQEALTSEGRERGVFVEFVDVSEGELGNLLTLVVGERQALATSDSPWRPPVGVRRALGRLEARRDFAEAHGRLERAFDPALLGYEAVATTLRDGFRAATMDGAASRAFFGQEVLPGAASTLVLPRPRCHAALDAWWQAWSQSRSVAVVHGREGSGKTWLVASWVAERLLGGPNGPPMVVWCGWRRFRAHGLDALLTDLLAEGVRAYGRQALKRRVQGWAGRRGSAPAMLLVLDGLNERDAAVWPAWFSSALHSVRCELPGLGIVVTTRTAMAEETVRWLSQSGATAAEVVVGGTEVASGTSGVAVPAGLASPTVIEIEDFDDEELSAALERAGVGDWEPDPGLRRLMRRPKYFARALRLRSQLQQAGEPTVERLLWEEMKARQREHLGTPVSDEAFQAMLAGLARRHGAMTALPHVSRAEVAEELASEVADVRLALQELATAGIFVPVPGALGRMQLHRKRLPQALALLLVERVCAATDGGSSVGELVERSVEELGDSDLVAEVLSFAVCIVLVPSGGSAPPEDAAVALLAALCQLRNASQAWVNARPWGFFPRAPRVFRRLAEEWAGALGDHAARSRIGYCFAGIGEGWADHPGLVEMCERWLGFVHPEGFRSRVPGNPETRIRIDAVRADPSAAWVITEVGDPSLLRLAQLALLVASHSRGAAYGRALVSWAVSQETMDELAYDQEARWLSRMSDEGLRRALLDAAADVEGRSWPHTRPAAALLYRLEGSVDADRRAQELDPRDDWWRRRTPTDDDPVRAAWIEAANCQRQALDPAVEVVFTKAELALGGLDPAEVFRGSQRTSQDSWLEEMEPALCRVAPGGLASFYRAAARSWIHGTAEDAERGAHDLDNVFLLLEPADRRNVTALARRLWERQPSPREAHTEANASGIALASMRRSAHQLRFLLRRPAENDHRDWMTLLTPFSRSQVAQSIAVIVDADAKEQRRRLMFSWPDEITLSEEEREQLWQAICGRDLGILSATPAIRSRDAELTRRCAEAGIFDRDHLSDLLSTEEWLRRALAAPALSRPLDPASESWLIAERGFDATELVSWLERVDAQVGGPRHRDPMGPPDTYCAAVFECALELRPGVVGAWCEAMLSKSERGRRMVLLDLDVVSALIVALVNRNDRRALALVRRLGRGPYERVPLRALLLLPFEAGRTATATDLLSDLIERAVTDDALHVLARTAAEHAATDWLVEVSTDRESSGRLFDRARSVALRGLGRGEAELQAQLAEVADRELSWVRHVADWARRQNRRDSWSRHWFRAYLREPARERAWAAFRLFLRTATRMTGSWIHDEIDAAGGEPDHDMRLRHFHLNLFALNRKLEKQGKTMEKRLFGWAVPSGDMQPWKETWHLQ